MKPDPEESILQRTARLLAGAPMAEAELAARALGLRGNPAARSRIVRSLLSSDARFERADTGIWSLRSNIAQVGPPLSRLPFAVVDVETTGGALRDGHGVTEIAILQLKGGVVYDAFETLVDPGRPIPKDVSRLTGISSDAVRAAPLFEEIATRVARLLQGRVFVAHNVGFDWGWISRALTASACSPPRVARLCTLALARRLIPGLYSYGLDGLGYYFDIEIRPRHRAGGDARATARILTRLLERAERMGIGDLHALQRYLGGRSHATRSRSSRRAAERLR